MSAFECWRCGGLSRYLVGRYTRSGEPYSVYKVCRSCSPANPAPSQCAVPVAVPDTGDTNE